ncbi:hypothetical protein [Streptomyces sp. RG80]|uniref:hypothetical protein n=1 Tax=Streptomyces sp. RG80 TaxID=3157340 RepID=UPI00338F0677
MAVGGHGSRVAWVGATCVLVAGALTYALAGEHTGLLRTSGIAYRFRHREFQEWLVRHPEPVPEPRR